MGETTAPPGTGENFSDIDYASTKFIAASETAPNECQTPGKRNLECLSINCDEPEVKSMYEFFQEPARLQSRLAEELDLDLSLSDNACSLPCTPGFVERLKKVFKVIDVKMDKLNSVEQSIKSISSAFIIGSYQNKVKLYRDFRTTVTAFGAKYPHTKWDTRRWSMCFDLLCTELYLVIIDIEMKGKPFDNESKKEVFRRKLQQKAIVIVSEIQKEIYSIVDEQLKSLYYSQNIPTEQLSPYMIDTNNIISDLNEVQRATVTTPIVRNMGKQAKQPKENVWLKKVQLLPKQVPTIQNKSTSKKNSIAKVNQSSTTPITTNKTVLPTIAQPQLNINCKIYTPDNGWHDFDGNVVELINDFNQKGIISLALSDQDVSTLSALKDASVRKTLQETINVFTALFNTKALFSDSSEVNEDDAKRRFAAFKFDDNTATEQVGGIFDKFTNIFTNLTFLRDGTKARNGDGEEGAVLLWKIFGCLDQLLHTDYANNTNLSFYEFTRIVGGSFLINFNDYDDSLVSAEGDILLPRRSISLLAGNKIHGGSGNYTIPEGVFKFHAYVDAPEFNRKEKLAQQDKVYIYHLHPHVTVTTTSHSSPNSTVLLSNKLKPCTCMLCGVTCYYFSPFCMSCLSSQFKMKVKYHEATKMFGVTSMVKRLSGTAVLSVHGREFDILTCDLFKTRYGFTDEMSIEPEVKLESPSDMYFVDCLSKRSFLSLLKRDPVNFNCVAVYDETTRAVSLVLTKDIPYRQEYVLKGTYNSTYSVVCDEESINVANGGKLRYHYGAGN